MVVAAQEDGTLNMLLTAPASDDQSLTRLFPEALPPNPLSEEQLRAEPKSAPPSLTLALQIGLPPSILKC